MHGLASHPSLISNCSRLESSLSPFLVASLANFRLVSKKPSHIFRLQEADWDRLFLSATIEIMPCQYFLIL